MKNKCWVIFAMLVVLLFCIGSVNAVSDDAMNETVAVADSSDESAVAVSDEQAGDVDSALPAQENDDEILGSDYPSYVEEDGTVDYIIIPEIYIFRNCAVVNIVFKDSLMEAWVSECTEESMFTIPDEFYEGSPNFHFNISFFNTTTNDWQKVLADEYVIPFPGYNDPETLSWGGFDNVHSYYATFDFMRGKYKFSFDYDGQTLELDSYNWDTEEYEKDTFEFPEFSTEFTSDMGNGQYNGLNIAKLWSININNGISLPISVYEGYNITISPDVTISDKSSQSELSDSREDGGENRIMYATYFKEFDVDTELEDMYMDSRFYDDYYCEFNPDDFSVKQPTYNITVHITKDDEDFKTFVATAGESYTFNDLPVGEYIYYCSYSDPYYGSSTTYSSRNKITVKEVPSPIYNGGGIYALKEAIDAHNVIYLNEDAVYNSSTDIILDSRHNNIGITNVGISIDKNLTIYGNNHTIDAKNTIRLFSITNNANVILKDLTITNSGISTDGGAITLSSGSLTIENCTFINNHASSKPQGVSGGAIYVGSNCNLTVKDSEFNSNYIVPSTNGAYNFYGGAIYCGDYVKCNISNTEFLNNYLDKKTYSSVAMYGGAIVSTGANSINTITNCTFINNSATNGRGAVYTRVGNITGCVFDDNHGSSDNISIYYEPNGKGIISHNVFLDNSTQIMLKNNAANVVEQYNWWATNEPGNLTCIENTYNVPNKYVVMNVLNNGKDINVNLIRDSERQIIPNIELLPVRDVVFEGDVDNLNVKTVNGIATTTSNSELSDDNKVNVTVDGYTITYTPKYNISSSIIYVKNTTLLNNGTVMIQFTGDDGHVDGKAIVYFNDTKYTVDVVDNIVVLDVGYDFTVGIYDIYYEYLGSSKYFEIFGKINGESKFEVKKTTPEISYTKEHNVLTFNLSQKINPTGTINVTLGNVTKNLTLNNGIASYNFGLDIAEEGTYDLKVIYNGDDNYNDAILEDTSEITKALVTIDGVPDEILSFEYNTNDLIKIRFYLIYNETRITISTGSMVVYDENNRTFKLARLYHSFDDMHLGKVYAWDFNKFISDFDIGTHEMRVVFGGNGYYLPVNATFKLTINPTLSVTSEVSENSIILNINSTSDASGNYVVIANDEVVANGTLTDGHDTLVLDNFEPGNYDIKVIWQGDDKYPGANATTFIHVLGSSQWPSLGGNPQNSGIADVTRKDNVVILWNATIGGDLHSSPIIDSLGNIYLNDGTIRSFTSNGTFRWANGPSSAGIAIYDDQIILAPVAGDNMRLFDATSGTWLNGMSYGHASSVFAPIFGPDKRIYTPTQYGYAQYATDFADSGNCWISIFTDDDSGYNNLPYRFYFTVPINGIGYGSEALKASPSFDGSGYIYVNTVQGLKIVDLKTNDIVVEIPINAVGRPVIDAYDVAYILNTNSNGIYAYTLEGPLWNNSITGGIGSTLAVDNENALLYAVSANGNLYKYDSIDGNESLVYELGANGVSIILDADSNVYVSTAAGDIVALSAEGDLLWTINLGSKVTGQLAMANNGVIYAVADKKLYALGFDANMTVSGENVSVFDDEIITVTIAAEGNVTITFNGESTEVPIENGTATLNVGKLIGGVYSVSASYAGDGVTYGPAFAETTFEIIKADAELNVEVNDGIITVSINENATGDVVVTVGDISFVKNAQNLAPIDAANYLGKGTYPVTVSYAGNDIFAGENLTGTVTVKAATIIVAPDVSVAYKDPNGEVVATIVNQQGKPLVVNVNVIFNGEEYALRTDSNGRISIPIGNLTPGKYAAEIIFKGSTNYRAVNASALVTVTKSNTVISAQDVSVAYKDPTGELVGTITNEHGKALVVNLNVNFNGKDYTVRTGSDGRFSLPVGNLTPGKYSATISYKGSSNYRASSTTALVTVTKSGTVISAPDISIAYKDSTGELVATITNEHGKPLVVNLNVNLNGKDYTVRTDSNGRMSLPIGTLASGKHVATISYKGSKNYEASSATVQVNVNKAASVISAQDVSVAYRDPNAELSALVISEHGKTLVVDVTVNLNGKNYTVKTDSNGRLSIPLDTLSPGNYTATIIFKGSRNYQGFTTTAQVSVRQSATTISAPDVSVAYKDPNAALVATITNEHGKVLGVSLNVNLNGKDYTLWTGSDGTISLPVDTLTPGNYTATISYKGSKNYEASSTTAQVVVAKSNTVISAPDVTVTSGDSNGALVATVTNQHGKPLVVSVKVNLNGKTTTVKTDSNGQISVPTKDLKAGTYDATISYKGSGNYNGSTVTTQITVI